MSYLLSLLGKESSLKGADQLLCYYINTAANIKIIRVMDEAKCLFEHIVFSGERILFTAFPESYLEIYLPLIDEIEISRIACKLLDINEVSNLAKSAVKVFK